MNGEWHGTSAQSEHWEGRSAPPYLTISSPSSFGGTSCCCVVVAAAAPSLPSTPNGARVAIPGMPAAATSTPTPAIVDSFPSFLSATASTSSKQHVSVLFSLDPESIQPQSSVNPP